MSSTASRPPTRDLKEILAAAREILPWMIEIRRDLHRHPELSLEEHRTSSRVRGLLAELKIGSAIVGGTGVLGLLGDPGGSGSGRGRAVALRADLDALPLQDAKAEAPYRSQVPGTMHACGHDVHTAILLGAARILAGMEELPGTVKLLFQPAEETVGGAQTLIDEGVLDDPTVDAVFGLHVEPAVEAGKIEVRYGQRNAASDNVYLVIHGQSGHAAYPAATIDAIVIAAQVISTLQTVVSRGVDARQSAVVSFGTIRGGAQRNIIADRVELTGTVRTLDPAIRERVLRRLRETAEGVATALGGRAEVEIEPSFPPLINDDAMVEVVRRNAAALVGEDNVLVKPLPNMGVEDFSYYLRRAPGAFFSLGTGNEALGTVYPLHHERFDVDESSMALGAAVQVLNALAVLGPDPASEA